MKNFVWAFRGLAFAVMTQRNLRIHLCVALHVIAAGLITKITAGQWAAVLICIGSVTALECLNTSIESLCDTLRPERDSGIAHTKDAAAGAVLLAAMAAAVTGGMIFFNEDKISAMLIFFREKPLRILIPAVTLGLSVLFVRGGGKREESSDSHRAEPPES